MIRTNLARIIKSGWQSFWRNYWLSTATVAVMSLSLLVIGALMLFNMTIQTIVRNLQNRVDVSVYFNQNTEEAKILAVRQELSALNEVKNIDYVSQESALAVFKEKHKDSEVLMQSLAELDQNPLEASLNIKANSATQYEAIANYLNQERFRGLIDKVNYKQNKDIIDRLIRFTTNIQRVGWIASFVLAFLALLVTFNTVRLTMYNWREEISVMRFVGAGNWFIRGPFLVEGVLYGAVASIGTLAVLYPILLFVSPKIANFLPDANLLLFYKTNLWQFLALLMGIGVALGSISSFIAIRRYLRA